MQKECGSELRSCLITQDYLSSHVASLCLFVGRCRCAWTCLSSPRSTDGLTSCCVQSFPATQPEAQTQTADQLCVCHMTLWDNDLVTRLCDFCFNTLSTLWHIALMSVGTSPESAEVKKRTITNSLTFFFFLIVFWTHNYSSVLREHHSHYHTLLRVASVLLLTGRCGFSCLSAATDVFAGNTGKDEK